MHFEIVGEIRVVETIASGISNDGYEGSLELRKLYEVLEDVEAAADGLLRVIDEDEDYLYPASWFVSIPLSTEIEEAILASTRSARR